jgi:hypothetical protein
MAQLRRKKAEDALLAALACGATAENAARAAGVCERTVYRRLTDPAFRKQLDALRADMVQRTANMLSAAALESVKTLLTLQKEAPSPAVRLGAAKAVLELSIRMRESSELLMRIAALEEHLQGTARRVGVRAWPTGTGEVGSA